MTSSIAFGGFRSCHSPYSSNFHYFGPGEVYVIDSDYPKSEVEVDCTMVFQIVKHH